MATLYITEFDKIVKDQTEEIQAIRFPAITTQTVTIGASSAASSAFNAKTRLVRVVSDVDCHIEYGTSPTATTSKTFLPAYVPEYFGVDGGNKIAVI